MHDIISKRLDFDDFFQFVGVCKNLRAFHKIYWRNFLASQEPLIVQISFHVKKSFSFISISGQKAYHLDMMDYFRHFSYSTTSSGYFIRAGYNNSLSLVNPFTGIKKVIDTPTFEVNYTCLAYHGLFAFGKCSEEFVLVVLCYNSLHVYQSRNCGWVTYTTKGNPWMVVDFVVLHNMIYVVTDKANIGVLSLNSANIKFLKLKSIPDKTSLYFRLVNCDEQLLVVDSMLNVYKIDFSTMNYVKLETLGDIALFNVSDTNCYALSNPNKWGYESNSVYVIRSSSPLCRVYSGDDKKLQKCITPPAPHGTYSKMLDWCFRHLRHEVDFSLIE